MRTPEPAGGAPGTFQPAAPISAAPVPAAPHRGLIRSGLSGLVLGSTALVVLRATALPVLLVSAAATGAGEDGVSEGADLNPLAAAHGAP